MLSDGSGSLVSLLLVWATQFFFYIAQAHVSGLASLVPSPAFTRKAKRREHVLSAHIHRARSICTLYLRSNDVAIAVATRSNSSRSPLRMGATGAASTSAAISTCRGLPLSGCTFSSAVVPCISLPAGVL